MKFSELNQQDLRAAKRLLENPGLAAKLTDTIGSPIEKGFEMLPASWNQGLNKVTQTALTSASDAAIFTMKDVPGEKSSNLWHKLGVAVSGGVGGYFGVAAMAVELPVSTTIILRSIADIARSEGESIADPETQMSCLEVFAFGGASPDDDGTETGYFAVRSALAKSITDAAEYVVRKKTVDSSAPVLVKLVAKIAERFGVQVTQKAAAQAIPAIGAAGGAIVNTLFIDHFQDMARGHFTVRRLEKVHGEKKVRKLYDAITFED